MEHITPQQLKRILEAPQPPRLIDVRSPAEFAQVHVRGAVNLPLTSLTLDDVRGLLKEKERTVVFICQSGGRSKQACTLLGSDKELHVISAEGGTEAALKAGISCVIGSSVMSIERQVRIAAGVLMLLGIILGEFVNRNFLGLSAFVGAGLVFAGVTNSCGMARVLMLLPWNRSNSCSI